MSSTCKNEERKHKCEFKNQLTVNEPEQECEREMALWATVDTIWSPTIRVLNAVVPIEKRHLQIKVHNKSHHSRLLGENDDRHSADSSDHECQNCPLGPHNADINVNHTRGHQAGDQLQPKPCHHPTIGRPIKALGITFSQAPKGLSEHFKPVANKLPRYKLL